MAQFSRITYVDKYCKDTIGRQDAETMDYLPRIADKQLDLALEAFGGALIKGPKGCGKTTTAKQRTKTVVEFPDEDVRENLLMIANTAPSKLLAGEKPILFD